MTFGSKMLQVNKLDSGSIELDAIAKTLELEKIEELDD